VTISSAAAQTRSSWLETDYRVDLAGWHMLKPAD